MKKNVYDGKVSHSGTQIIKAPLCHSKAKKGNHMISGGDLRSRKNK